MKLLLTIKSPSSSIFFEQNSYWNQASIADCSSQITSQRTYKDFLRSNFLREFQTKQSKKITSMLAYSSVWQSIWLITEWSLVRIQLCQPHYILWGVSSVGRAMLLQGIGHWFNPSTFHHFNCCVVTQLVEQGTVNAFVLGSSPSFTASVFSYEPIYFCKRKQSSEQKQL